MLMRSLLLVIGCLWALPAAAVQVNGCPDFIPPEIAVKQLVAEPTFDNTKSLPSIRQMTIDHGKDVVSTHDVPVGITAASLKLDSRYKLRLSVNPNDNMACAQVSAYDLNIGFDDTTVYLARELPYYSCSYRAVLEHEMRHVKTDRQFIGNYAPYLPDQLRAAMSRIGTIRASSTETAEKRISAQIDAFMADLGAYLTQQRQAMQAQIDTPAEYTRLGNSCNGELARLIAEAKKAGGY
ncbi:MAG: hypothetical protein PHW63_08895 [Alphaproteobacteria bacterium]|nr:hypothetical protein [Alphaproteobacteria bacterium]